MYPLLFIHPDQKLVKIYESHLGRHFAFDSAHDGLSALRKIRLGPPHVIVSDFHLPYLSGLALLKFVRSTPFLAATPFIFLAGKGDIGQGLAFGANDWVNQMDSTPDFLLDKIAGHLKHNIRLLNLR